MIESSFDDKEDEPECEVSDSVFALSYQKRDQTSDYTSLGQNLSRQKSNLFRNVSPLLVRSRVNNMDNFDVAFLRSATFTSSPDSFMNYVDVVVHKYQKFQIT